MAGEYPRIVVSPPVLDKIASMSKIKVIEDALKAAARIAPAEAETGVGKLLQSMPNEPPSSAPVQQALDVARAPLGVQTVLQPRRNAYPGIYGDPREIAEQAAKKVAPEHPSLRELFGVTRQDLYDIGGTRVGNELPKLNYQTLKSGQPSAAPETVQNIMIPQNAQRLQDILVEAGKQPGLRIGMDSWYVMDPAYQRLVEMFGRDEGAKRFNKLINMTGMASPGSDVMTEINRGTAANAYANKGAFDLFKAYGGLNQADKARLLAQPGSNISPFLGNEFLNFKGHPYHSTSQADPMARYLRSGQLNMTTSKVPLYIQSSGVPETGFQTMFPVADAHLTRGVGLSDTRTAKDYNKSMNMAEYNAHFGPWFYERVAQPLEMESVRAQGRLWGGLSHITGVESPIGAPKLELLARSVYEDALRRGIDPRLLRDRVLSGEDFIQVPYAPKVRGKRMYGGPAELAYHAAGMYLGGRRVRS